MLKIGITGGIGSGKSLVCNIFERLGIAVYYADTAAKKIMVSDLILVEQIRQLFGQKAYFADGRLNRSYLSDRIFRDKEKKEKLESFVHPAVGRHYRNWLKDHTQSPYILKETALMFETGSYRLFDKVITVYAPSELRIKGVIKRDAQRSRAEIEAIMAKQMPEEEKMQQADFIIKNDETQLLIPQVIDLHEQFKYSAVP